MRLYTKHKILFEYLFRFLRKIFNSHKNNITINSEDISFEFEGDMVSNLIKSKLSDENPCMIARLGNVEMKVVAPYYLNKKYSLYENIIKYIKREIGPFWWNYSAIANLGTNAGFFPIEGKYLEKFSELVINDLKEIDILGSWTPFEKILVKQLKNSIRVPMKDLEPYYHSNPWTEYF